MARTSSIRWGRVMTVAVVSNIVSFLVGIIAYVSVWPGSGGQLGFERVDYVFPWAYGICLAVLTWFATGIVAHRAEKNAHLAGLVTGLLTVIPFILVSYLGGPSTLLESVALPLLTVGAGWLGANWSRARNQQHATLTLGLGGTCRSSSESPGKEKRLS